MKEIGGRNHPVYPTMSSFLDLNIIFFHFELLNVFEIRHLQRFLNQNNKVLCQSCQNVLSKVALYVFLQHIFFYSIEPSRRRESVNEMSGFLVWGSFMGRGGGTMRKTLRYYGHAFLYSKRVL